MFKNFGRLMVLNFMFEFEKKFFCKKDLIFINCIKNVCWFRYLGVCKFY